MLFCFAKKQYAQNLVPNPSFETYTTCPNNYGQINKAVGWNYVQAAQSAEYYNSCATGTQISVPRNFFNSNYQLPRTGNAYAGLQTLRPYDNLRGNICTQLSTPLIVNNYYLAKFYAVSVQGYKIVSNNLALNFSNTLSYTVAPNTTLNLPMHIYKYGNPVLNDTLNWTEIIGIYKANGTEQFIIIGNFRDSLNTKVDTIDINGFAWATYYMIDDVSVEPICTPFWSYRDTTVAIGDSVLIGPAITGLNINWYDATGTFITNAPGIYVKPNSPTFYAATEDFCGSTITYTINVGVNSVGLVTLSGVEAPSILPNPTNNLLTISSQNDFNKIELLSITGQILLSESVRAKSHQLQLQNFAEGIYFVKVFYGNGLNITKKLILNN